MTSNRTVVTGSGAHWAPTVGFVFLVPIMLAGMFEPSFFLVSLSAVTVGIVAVPLCRTRQIDWFSPWNMMFYGVSITVFLRAIYITFDIPDSDTIDQVFLGGRPKEFLLVPMLILLIGMSMTTLGYLAGPDVPRRISYKIFQSDDWAETRFWVVVITLQLFSIFGVLLFIKYSAGQISMDNISAHRGLSEDLPDYRSYGYLRWLVSLSDIASCLLVVKIVSERRVYFKQLIAFVAFLIASTTSLLFSFIVQVRSGLAAWFINVVVILYYLRNKKLPLFRLAILFMFILIPIRYMTGLRPGSSFGEVSPSNLVTIRSFEPMILATNGIDVSKTAHIMAAIPESLDYQYGATLLRIVYLWIPRQIWPAKPVNVDTTVGMAVFGATSYGAGAVPPGLIAEMYWNFWIPGIIVGCSAAGYLVRIIYTQFRRYDTNRNVIILYATCFMNIGGAMLGSSFSGALLGFLSTFLPTCVVLHIITRRARSMPDKVKL
jgi:oligosaccharide repeat unit polymerase